MPKLFISYRRKSWAFTHRLAEELRRRLDADIFVDVANIDAADFEVSILRHLRASDAMLLVVTELTFADRIHKDDDWVRREIAEALHRKIPIVLVCVEGLLPPPGLPDDIKAVARMQGISFYPEYFTAAVEMLVAFIARIGAAQRLTDPAMRAPLARAAAPSSEPAPPEKSATGSAALAEAMRLLKCGDPEKAKFLLDQIAAAGFSSRFISAAAVASLCQYADEEIAKNVRRRRAEIEYEEIMMLVSFRLTEDQGIDAYMQWRQEYADLADQLDTYDAIQPRLDAKAAELLAKGDQLRQQRDYPGAIDAFSEMLKIAPEQANGYLWRGFARQEGGDIEGALADYERTLQLDPDNAIAYHVRGQIWASRGLLDDAIADFTNAYQRDSRLRAEFAHLYAETYLRRAEAAGSRSAWAMKSADHDTKILEDFERAIALAPDPADAYLRRASYLSATAHHRDALADYDRVIALRPQDAAVFMARADARRLAGDSAGAHADYAQAIDLQPHHISAYLEDALLYEMEKHWAPVLDHYRRIGQHQPQDHPFHNLALEGYRLLTEEELEAGNFGRAVELSEEAISLFPDQASVYYWLCSHAYTAIGDFTSAVEMLNELLARWPDDDAAYYQRGLLLDRQGDLKGAVSDYSQAICIAPTAVALNNRGVARYKLGEIAAAIADLEAALKIQPDYHTARDNLIMARRPHG
jgi:tetratricopeptide (TPR) repeat protein